MPFELRYHLDVKSVDIPLLDARLKARIKNAIETRLMTAPLDCFAPLAMTRQNIRRLKPLPIGPGPTEGGAGRCDYFPISFIPGLIMSSIICRMRKEIRATCLCRNAPAYAKLALRRA